MKIAIVEDDAPDSNALETPLLDLPVTDGQVLDNLIQPLR